MGTSVLYRVPYEIRVNATDLSSGKQVSNVFYTKCGIQLVAPPAYAQPVAGTSDTGTLLAAFKTLFKAQIVPLLSSQYRTVEYIMRAIMSYGYTTLYHPIASVSVGSPTVVNTSTPHGLVTGDSVDISGTTGTLSINQVWTATVTGPNTFTIATNTTGQTYAGGGQEQKASGALKFIYGSLDTLADVQTGGIAGDALPLFSDASVRRLGADVGKSFQGRNSFAPIGEASQVDGAFTTSAKTAWTTALTALVGTPLANGGSDSSSSLNFLINVSKKIAFTKAAPFIGSDSWTSAVNSMSLRPNMGSFIRRKPKLSALLS